MMIIIMECWGRYSIIRGIKRSNVLPLASPATCSYIVIVIIIISTAFGDTLIKQKTEKIWRKNSFQGEGGEGWVVHSSVKVCPSVLCSYRKHFSEVDFGLNFTNDFKEIVSRKIFSILAASE